MSPLLPSNIGDGILWVATSHIDGPLPERSIILVESHRKKD